MQNLKFGVLVCGLLGLIGCFLPMVSEGGMSISFFKLREFPGAASHVYIVMAGFAVAAAMGGLAVAKGMQRWMSIVALVAFGLVLFKFRAGIGMGEGGGLFGVFKGAIGAKLMGIGMFAGVVFSILTIAKPEPTK